MLAKHFRWTVYMLKYDIIANLNDFFFKLMLFLVFELVHFPH